MRGVGSKPPHEKEMQIGQGRQGHPMRAFYASRMQVVIRLLLWVGRLSAQWEAVCVGVGWVSVGVGWGGVR